MVLIREKCETNPKWGKKPEERSPEELINLGVINLDKPSGPTSHQVTFYLKEILNLKKAGHSGTLDPRVTGVLPIALGKATPITSVLLGSDKEYVGIMHMHKDIPLKTIVQEFNKFTGDIKQLPPVRSAIKRVERQRRINSFELTEKKEKDVLFRVSCEAGTYIRKLIFDVGKDLGIGANMYELRRTKASMFNIEDSVTLYDIKDAYTLWKEKNDSSLLYKYIQPVEKVTQKLKKIWIKDSAVGAVCYGAFPSVTGVCCLDEDIKEGDICAIMSLKNELVALARAQMTSNKILTSVKGIAAKTERVFMEIDTYPRMWK